MAIAERFGISKLKDFQEDTINKLLEGRDVYLSMKTGGGKSLCYQAFPLLWTEKHRNPCNVLVITPLISIMKEQCESLMSLGFTATYIGRNSEEDDQITDEKFQFLFTSPEAILSVTKWREMVTRSQHFKLIVVDEAHTVLRWGESGCRGDEPFRVWYGKIGEIRSLIQCPILLITATANKAARSDLKRKFAMNDCFELIDNPDRDNIKLFVKKVKSTIPIADLFLFLVRLLKEKKELCERYIIFCPSIKLCGDVFSAFKMEKTQNIDMYHSKTIETVKENIKQDMQDENGKIRVLIATSAAGMGVNFKGVNNVIHFGPPKDMDSFVQQLGRAGRDGSQTAMALLLYNSRQCKNLDDDMKKYIDNSDKCRRQVMLSAYNYDPAENRVKHLCCDICNASCSCGKDNCNDYEHSFMDYEELQETSSDNSESESDTDSF
ncbi:probable ATP-dependent DNA helicase RecS [Ostrea edulis]|uniref:probable ATP-dependent DNA helicase RecS n=1 Tax=Ostrea edulis TaxID=37623 RepID=UPI0020957C06|nr:probable ATP-dependent DNA helicase RecS [Ostrea edulis]XP_056017969.1 probable ATP-dependent DNA helicase RecS [Ostrea edulis]